MKSRVVIMYTEIGCFVGCVCGWILVCSTMLIEYWAYSEVGTAVLTSPHLYSNLWKYCVSDSTGMTDCKDFPSLLSLELYIHLCRALIFTSIILGFFGAVLALIGMKCTKLGGSDITNARITFSAGMNYLLSGFCSMFAYSWYGYKVISEFLDPTFPLQKYELGAALYIGWGGSSLLFVGGLVYSILAGNEGCQSRLNEERSMYSVYLAPPSGLESKKHQTPSPLPKATPLEETNPLEKTPLLAETPPLAKTPLLAETPLPEKPESSDIPLSKAYSKGEYV
ncbi:claudin-10 [Hoplias malabaricus]|uniref:claudin-10 n=1 Tax=Hoplias malabaricus TaxID=27720 RepID=UPI003462747A